MLVRNASPSGPMCFSCLIFSLAGPCELVMWDGVGWVVCLSV